MRILTQNPLSVGFGGIELQASKYIEHIRSISTDIDIGFFQWEETDIDILHIVGIHSGINPYWTDVLKAKGVKIVVSSVFYLKPNEFLDFRRPLVYKLFSYVPFHVVNWMKKVITAADLILPNSLSEAEQLIDVFGVKKKSIKILHNGVEQSYYDHVDPDAFRKKYSLKKYLLCVSHIEPRKNHDKLIEAFISAKEDGLDDVQLVLLGDYRGNYFQYHDKIRGLLEKNHQSILHINNLKNTDIIFKSAYLGCSGHILLSSLETPGLSNLEALMAGKGLLLGDCLPVREYFGDFATYVNASDSGGIERGIKKLLSEDIRNDQEKREKAISYARDNFSWHSIGERLLENYTALIINQGK